jgi:hypothetical protein
MAHVVKAVLVMISCAAVVLPGRPVADLTRATHDDDGGQPQRRAPGRGLTVEVVLEQVNAAKGIITARACGYLITPKGSVGGAVFTDASGGHLATKVARFERLPVMPEARMESPSCGRATASSYD